MPYKRARAMTAPSNCYLPCSFSSPQTLTTIVNFHSINGANPDSPLIQGRNGALYGTAEYGGTHRPG